MVNDIQYRLDVNSLHRDQDAGELGLNEIGRIQLRTTVPLLCDPYAKNHTTGSFILIDEATGVTVGAGMINSGSGYNRSDPAPCIAGAGPPSWLVVPSRLLSTDHDSRRRICHSFDARRRVRETYCPRKRRVTAARRTG
jgi:sulfate adenylyltransferase subunit 1 (EFTu-like GTPase family)